MNRKELHNDEKSVQEAVINLYRSATGDNISTTNVIVEKFAKNPIKGPLEYYSQSGRVHSGGHIQVGQIKQKSAVEILRENGLMQ